MIKSGASTYPMDKYAARLIMDISMPRCTSIECILSYHSSSRNERSPRDNHLWHHTRSSSPFARSIISQRRNEVLDRRARGVVEDHLRRLVHDCSVELLLESQHTPVDRSVGWGEPE